MLKRAISLLLSLAMVLSLMPTNFQVFAEEVPAEEVAVEVVPETVAEEEVAPEEPPAIEESVPVEEAENYDAYGTILLSGRCGTNLSWYLYSNGELVISGWGPMDDYKYNTMPWNIADNRSNIKTITIEHGVTSIGNYAFAACPNLTSVTMPSTVTSIGYAAFSACSSLYVLDIGKNVATIGGSAFSNCTSLTQVTLGDALTSIGDYAFDSTRLMDLVFPKTLTSIGNWVFLNCYGLKNLSFKGNAPSFGSGTFSHFYGKVYYRANDSTWTENVRQNYGGEVEWIASNPLIISKGTCGRYAEWVLTEDGLLTISGSGAMDDYSLGYIPWNEHQRDIKNVAIEKGITGIGLYAFRNCSYLTSLVVPESVTNISASAFEYSSIREITFEGDAPTFGENAFKGKVITVHYPANNATWTEEVRQNYGGAITWVAEEAVVAEGTCGTNLTWKLTETGTLTISGTGAMEDYTYNKYAPWHYVRGLIKKIDIEDGVTTIGSEAFSDCSNLTEVEIPSSVTSIGDRAFFICTGLDNVYIKDINAWCKIAFDGYFSNPMDYADRLYNLDEAGNEMTEVVLDDTVTAIPAYTFDNSPIVSITIPDSVKSIGKFAFRNCVSLKDVYVTDINAWCKITFDGYDSNPVAVYRRMHILDEAGNEVTEVVLDDTVTTIPAYTFAQSSIVSIAIPDSVTSIGNYAFNGCDSLKDVYITDPIAWCQIVFGSNPVYHAEYMHILDEAGNEVTEVVLNDTVTAIPYGAFKNSPITSITIPDSVTTIGGFAFDGCTGLAEIVIPETVTTIGEYAFHGLSRLERVTIPGSVVNLGEGAFLETGLTEVHFEGSAPEFGPTYVGSWGCFSSSKPITIYYPKDDATWTNEAFMKFEGRFEGITWIESCANNHTEVIDAAVEATCTTDGLTEGKHCSTCGKVLVEQKVIPGGHKFDENGMCQNCGLISGTCGENLTWTLTTDGILTVSGIGAMTDFATASESPWYDYRTSITKVVLGDGVTSVGDRAFYNCTALRDVTIGNKVATIGGYAFRGCTALVSVTIPASVTEIKGSAFRTCSALEEVTFLGNAPTMGTYVFTDCHENLTLNCYEGSTGFDVAPWTDWKVVVNHVGQWVVEKEATCTTDGLRHIDCAYCGTIITEIIVGSHNYVDGICSVCNEVKLIASGERNHWSWKLDVFGTLTISGTGDMDNHSWRPDYTDKIVHVVIEEGITSIVSHAFQYCTNLVDITIPESVSKINVYAFNGCTSLKEVVIPEGVTYIANDVFEDCSSLVRVVIPESVTEIDSDAFRGCSSLTSITIPESVTSIGNCAFYGCSSLTEIVIPESVTSFGTYVFDECTALKKAVLPESIGQIPENTFSGCSSMEEVHIANGITSIGRNAFYECSALAEITIPDSVESIGDYAFAFCSGLTGITLGNGVTSIGGGAFSNCTSLISIVIPDSVTTLGGAFHNCASLTDVVIGDGVTAIPQYAFEACNNLKYLTIGKGVTSIGASIFGYDGGQALTDVYIQDPSAWCKIDFGTNPMSRAEHLHIQDEDGNEVTEVVLDDTVTSIPQYAFKGATITGIAIPDSVTSIGSSAFSGCNSLTNLYITDLTAWMNTSLSYFTSHPFYGSAQENGSNQLYLNNVPVTELVIPENVTTIGKYIFYGCNTLTAVTIPDHVTEIGEYAFCHCDDLLAIEIPGSVTKIGYNAFNGCSGLKEVTLNDGLVSIASSAFSNCSGLTEIVIPNSVTSIGSGALSGCSSLVSLTIPFAGNRANPAEDEYQYPLGYIFGRSAYEGGTQVWQYYYKNATTTSHEYYECYIPASLRSVTVTGDAIVRGAFKSCKMLTEIVLTGNQMSIGRDAFSYCEGLRSIRISGSVAEIGFNGFSYCDNLKDVYITDPSAWCKIQFGGSSANPMSYADYLHILDAEGNEVTELVLDDSVTTIPEYAFKGASIVSVVIPDSVTDVGRYAFSGCTSLTEIVISDGVASIGEYAFEDCTALQEIVIPDSVTSIGSSAFEGCSNLESMTIPFVGSSVQPSEDAKQNLLGYIFGTKQYENSVSTWQYMQSSVGQTYYIPASLKKVTVTGGEIRFGAFSNCSGLTTIVLPENITSIGPRAFYGCSALTDITIPDAVEEIGEETFYNCTALQAMTIPDGVTDIADKAFYGCTGLTNVVVGESVESIGEYAFCNCSFAEIVLPESLTSIGYEAFYGCTSLTEISIPDSVTSMGNFVFRGCSSLKEITFSGNAPTIDSLAFDDVTATAYYPAGNETWTEAVRQNYGGKITWKLYCPDEHTEVIDEAVDATCTTDGLTEGKHCSVCDEVIVAQEVVPAGHDFVDGVCQRCGLVTGTCGENLKWTLTEDGVLTISGVGEMTSYSLVSYPWYDYHNSIKTIVIQDEVTSIADYAFYGYKSLTDVTVGHGVVRIEELAFRNCWYLENLSLGNSVSVIEEAAFQSTALSSVTLPASVTEVGVAAFRSNKLQQIQVAAENPAYRADENGILFSKDGTTLVCYPGGKTGGYEIPDSVKTVGNYAFASCSGLTAVTIPDSVTILGEYAFNDCTQLTNVSLGNAVVEIGACAFYGCERLSSIAIHDSVRAIGGSAFEGCEKLTTITIGNSVEAIGGMAFYDCFGLEEITFTGNAPTFGYNAFCSVSATAYYPAGNETWTEEVRQNYGGTITWKAECRNGHTEVIDEAVAPSCTETGLTEGKHCSVCNEVLVAQQVVPAKGHTKGEVVMEDEVAPDCTNDGSYENVIYCTVCEEELSRETVVVPAKGHAEVIDDAVAPDCTNTGLTEGKHCDVCGEVLVEQEVVPVAGHNMEEVSCVAPTFDMPGTMAHYRCETCGQLFADLEGLRPVNPEDLILDQLVAEATVNGLRYETLEAALNGAKAGDVVTLVADAEAGNLFIPAGVTLDLAEYSLTVDYLFGVKSAFLTGTPEKAKLFVAKENVILAQDGYVNAKGQYVLPIWDPANNCFQFSLFVVNTDTGKGRGMKIDEEKEEIRFQFKHQATTALNNRLLADGASDNELSVIIRLSWTNEQGTAHQDFVYNDSQVAKVTGSYDYTFVLTGYSALNINLNTLVVQAMVVTNSGATAFGTAWTQSMLN